MSTSDRSEDDSFEDAPEPGSERSIPITRVEKTDDAPSHGEVPGTEAYKMRKQDAVPDQLEVVPEGTRSRSSSQSNTGQTSTSGMPIPKTVVEKVDPSSPSHGEVPGTEAHAIRKADAQPDEVSTSADNTRSTLEGSPTYAAHRSQHPGNAAGEVGGDEGQGGDDFDDFAEGDEEDDFGAFDEGDEAPIETPASQPAAQAGLDGQALPVLDLSGLSRVEELAEAGQPLFREIFPNLSEVADSGIPAANQSFLNERSQSLWSQLVAPPPLQPPDWVRSRIRRLFLVSLGVPVDLDEILPASKQKKLVLPSIDIENEARASKGEQGLANGSIAKLKQQNNSSASVNSSGSKAERRRRGQPAPPDLNSNTARLLCTTTSEAIENMTKAELKGHLDRLEELKQKANEALEYWLIQRDSANGDKEAFEEVIENLVKHAKKIRK